MAIHRRSVDVGETASGPHMPDFWNATQDDADAVVDVLLSAAQESEWWSDDSSLAKESQREEEQQIAESAHDWWLEVGEDELASTTPLSNPAPAATAPPPALRERSERVQSVSGSSYRLSSLPVGPSMPVKAPAPAVNFSRCLTRSVAKRKQLPSPPRRVEPQGRGGSEATLSMMLNDVEADEAMAVILKHAPPPTAVTPTPAPAAAPAAALTEITMPITGPSAAVQPARPTSTGAVSGANGVSPHTTAQPSTAAVVDDRVAADCFLVFSVERGEISRHHALAAARAIDTELRHLVELIRRVGRPGLRGRVQLSYAELSEHGQHLFDPLASIVKTARMRGIIATDPELLHQRTTVTLLCDVVKDASLDTYTFQQIRDHSIRRQSFKGRKSLTRRVLPTAPGAAGSPTRAVGPASNLTPTVPPPARSEAPVSSSDDLAAQLALLDAAQATVMAAPAASMSRKNTNTMRARPADPLATIQQLPDTAPVLQQPLSVSVRRGTLSSQAALTAARWVDKELHKLVAAMQQHGHMEGGKPTIAFGDLTRLVGDNFNPLSGVVKTAASRGVVSLAPRILLPRTTITLERAQFDEADMDTYSYQQVRQCSMRRGRKD